MASVLHTSRTPAKLLVTTLALVIAMPFWSLVAQGVEGDDAVSTIIVMRHAEKVAPDGDPPLTQEGRERAEHLKEVLGRLPISAVFSTDARRARETVEPLAKCLNLTIDFYKTIPEILKTISSPQYRGRTVMVMGHMGTAKELINLLGGTGGDCPGFEHDEICIAQITANAKPVVLRLKYGKILEPVKCRHP